MKKESLTRGGIALIMVAGGTYAAYEKIPAVHESINSFRNTFNPADRERLVETKQVNPDTGGTSEPALKSEVDKFNPKEIFDNTVTKGTFTDANSVTMTPEQYQETSPRLIKGDSVVIPLPIEYPEGQMPNVKFKKEKGSMGGKRLINGRLENREIVSDGAVTVNDVLIIDGIPVGSVLLAPFDGEIQFATSSGYEKPDGSLSLAAFSLYSKDSNGNTITLTFSTVNIKPLIVPSRIEYEKETNHTKPLTSEPIKAGDPIGIILTTRHDNPHYNGQLAIKALSRVEEDGKSRGGAAGIQIATTPEGQAIRLDRLMLDNPRTNPLP